MMEIDTNASKVIERATMNRIQFVSPCAKYNEFLQKLICTRAYEL